MRAIQMTRDGYGAFTLPLSHSETPEQMAARLRRLYPDARRLALVEVSPLARRIERFL